LEIAWLEDFLALDAKRSFSQAAEVRCVSQPAFSRRIQALEERFGTTLIDRSTSPITLTPMGKNFRSYALQMLRQTQDAKQFVQSQQATKGGVVRFAVAHTLATNFFPSWYNDIKGLLIQTGANAQVNATNVMEGAKALQDRETDFFVSFHHSDMTQYLPADRFQSVLLAHDEFLPFSAVVDGKPLFSFDASVAPRVPYLAYSPGTFFSQLVDTLHFQSSVTLNLEKIFQTQMAEAIKAMVLAGHGIGWLPTSCIAAELSQGRIKSIGSQLLGSKLEVRIHRTATPHAPVIDAIWKMISTQT
jgi:LysR family transcriptional regulator, hypochlorite-specific transcription factor HypT